MRKKELRMFLSTVAIVTTTIATYYVVASIAGGVNSLVAKAFGGLVSALSIVGLTTVLSLFGWYIYWLSERRSTGRARSGLHAVISVIVLITAAIIGLRWVQWGLSLFWLIPLVIPALLGAWLITMIARKTFTSLRPVADDRPTRLEDLDLLA